MARNLTLVLTACYLTILSAGQNRTTIMAALPAMTSDLAFGPAQVEWIVNAYLLASLFWAADQFGMRSSSAAGISRQGNDRSFYER
jgi:MFS family permease